VIKVVGDKKFSMSNISLVTLMK